MSNFRTQHDLTVVPDDDADDRSAASVVVAAHGAPFAVGSLVAGKYRVERELAEGGLGVVVVALHEELGQRVAIKYLKPQILARPALVNRFRREAQLAASIRSEHVVRIYDVGVLPVAGPFMVMEYLEGEDLGTRLMRGRLPPAEAIDYLVQACDALAEAHALGIVHRDLKPENMFLARRPGTAATLKILDFGISKVNEKTNRAADAPRVRQMTEEGERFGTPVYMSPEQILATPNIDLRTDIWSMGVVLFELLSGKLPFDAESIPALGAQIVRSPAVPLRAVLPTASPSLEAVIAKCLEKDRGRRYRNVAELVEELVRFAGPSSQPRIARIKHVVLAGGDSIRPPRSIEAVGPPTPLDPFQPVRIIMPSPADTPTNTPWASPTPIGFVPVDGGLLPEQLPTAPSASRQSDGRAPLAVALVSGVAMLFLLVTAAAGMLLLRHRPTSPVAPTVSGPAATASAEAGAPGTTAALSAVPSASDVPELSGSARATEEPRRAGAPVPRSTGSIGRAQPATGSAVMAPPATPPSAKPAPPQPTKTDYAEFGERR